MVLLRSRDTDMAIYLIDTSTFSCMMKQDPKIHARISSLTPTDQLMICPIIRGEILFGIEKLPTGRRRRDLETKAQSLFLAFETKDITDFIADYYAQIKNETRATGKQLSDNDLWIAATAVYYNAVIVAVDKDYSRLSQLSAEDWTK